MCANVIIATARLHNKCVRRRIGLPAPGDDDGDDDRDDNPCDHQERHEDNEGRVVRERLRGRSQLSTFMKAYREYAFY